MTLFDTDVVIWLTRGNDTAADVIDATRNRAVSAITYMELLHGAFNANEARYIRRTLDNYGFRVLPVTEAITNRAVSIMEAHALSTRLDPDDALIFATALEWDITLCSGNDKHFRGIDGLRADVFRPA